MTSAATPSIVAANHPGVLSISGTPAQSQTLMATVSDADGVPATVTYQWQQSSNGTTWSNINGATASTLTLGQAQVGSFVRATATYTDVLGSSENAVSSATPSQVANVNDLGAVTISGTATQNQTLTASVADLDGVPASDQLCLAEQPRRQHLDESRRHRVEPHAGQQPRRQACAGQCRLHRPARNERKRDERRDGCPLRRRIPAPRVSSPPRRPLNRTSPTGQGWIRSSGCASPATIPA